MHLHLKIFKDTDRKIYLSAHCLALVSEPRDAKHLPWRQISRPITANIGCPNTVKFFNFRTQETAL